MKKIIVSLLFIFMMPLIAFTQSSNFGNWMLLFGNKKISQKVNWHHEVQYRNYDAVGDLEQLLLRTGLGVNVTDNTNLLMGYGFIRSENYISDDDKITINEHRIFQQVITRQNVGLLRLQHRYRFEQRFVEENFRLRFRYFLGLAFPLWTNPDGIDELYMSAYNELFINTKQNVFDRNRLYGGLGYKLNTSLRFEIGYMNQFLANGNRDQLNLVCFFNW